MELLLEQGIATFKQHVVLKLRDGSERQYSPGEWLGKPPYNIDLRTCMSIAVNSTRRSVRSFSARELGWSTTESWISRQPDRSSKPSSRAKGERFVLAMVSRCLRVGCQFVSADIQVAGI